MGYARYIGRVGALAVALGVGAAMASHAGHRIRRPIGGRVDIADSSSKSSSLESSEFRCGVEVVIKDEDVGGYRRVVAVFIEILGGYRSGARRWLCRHRRVSVASEIVIGLSR